MKLGSLFDGSGGFPLAGSTWYNKLHTDAAEYKMWGNGIALPPALYCMQGMMDELKGERT